MTGRKHRSDAGRRVALRLVSLRGEADRLERERDLMRLELAKILRAPGGSWRDPEAVRLYPGEPARVAARSRSNARGASGMSTEAQTRSWFMQCCNRVRALERAAYPVALSGDRRALDELGEQLRLARTQKVAALEEVRALTGTAPRRRPVRLRAR